MLVDRLALIVVGRVETAIFSGQKLRSFIRFEAQIESAMQVGLFIIPQTPIGQHEVVVGLEILGIDGKRFSELFDGKLVFTFQEVESTQLISDHTVARIEGGGATEVLEGVVIEPLGLERQAIEVVGLGEVGIEGQGLAQHFLRT